MNKKMMREDEDVENMGIMQGFMDSMIADEDEGDEDEDEGGESAAMMMERRPNSPEILMNNLRGDMRSIDARRDELADLVGYQAATETPEQVLAALRAEVARVARDGVSEAELARIKTQWMAGEIYKLDAVFNQARELGVYWVSELPLDFGERLIRRLQTVTPAQVQSVAARYFGDDTLTVGILRPVPREAGAAPRTPPSAGHRH